jgi:hypothetical protein
MRKAFKVATAFTGAAACAAAFTPAAEAVTAPTLRTQVVPNVEHRNCPIGPSTTSMVFWWSAAAHHGPTCAGSGGVPGHIVFSHWFSRICTGNNKGYITSKPGGFHNSFGAGLSRLRAQFVYSVDITGHAGTFHCST